MEHLEKRKPEQTQISVGQVKRFRTQDSRSRGHQGRGRCSKCGRTHEGREGAPTARIRSFQCQSGEARVSAYVIAGMLPFAFFMLIISIFIALESCIGLGKHYLWFSSLLFLGLYHQELLYAIFHAEIH